MLIWWNHAKHILLPYSVMKETIWQKYFAIMVRVWDNTKRQAMTRFLVMPVYWVCIRYWKCHSRYAFWSRIKQKPNVFSLGCHLAARCAVTALKKLPVSVDGFLIDISYHFKYSAKCWSQYTDIREEFREVKPLKILKPCTTRWLSLERCIKRIINQWPLHAYFDCEDNIELGNKRVQRIAQ